MGGHHHPCLVFIAPQIMSHCNLDLSVDMAHAACILYASHENKKGSMGAYIDWIPLELVLASAILSSCS